MTYIFKWKRGFMRLAARFRAQHEADAECALRHVISKLKTTNPYELEVVHHENLWWLLTSKLQFDSPRAANDHFNEARAALANHTMEYGCDYIQEKEGEPFTQLLDWVVRER